MNNYDDTRTHNKYEVIKLYYCSCFLGRRTGTGTGTVRRSFAMLFLHRAS